jgi:UDP-N-acetylmuramoyl-tripeptide--D-alanyl-D-alanine ligase
VRIEWPVGTSFRLYAGGEPRDVTIGLLGRHAVYAALAAVAVACESGERLEDILPRLRDLAPVRGRLAPKPLPNGAWLLADDFKSALESIHAAFDVLEQVPAGRKVVVLGPIAEPKGTQSVHYRALGERIARTAQLAVFVGSFREYKAGVHKAGMPQQALYDASRGLKDAVEFLRREIRPGDVVLVKGRRTQRLERIGLALEGRNVRCALRTCRLRMTHCADCSKLETG